VSCVRESGGGGEGGTREKSHDEIKEGAQVLERTVKKQEEGFRTKTREKITSGTRDSPKLEKKGVNRENGKKTQTKEEGGQKRKTKRGWKGKNGYIPH